MEPNPPPTEEELCVLALRGYVECWTTGDGLRHRGVHDKLSVGNGEVWVDREIMPIEPVTYICLKLEVTGLHEE